jgi:hypothetical protein
MSNKKFDPHFDLFSQPGVSTLVDGIELLSALFHAKLFHVPAAFENKFINIASLKLVTH